MLYKIVLTIVRPLAYILYLLKVSYEGDLPRTGPVIYCQKHISLIDPVIIAITQKRTLSFMAKVELFKFPPLGWFFRQMNAFPVNRGKGDVAALKIALKVLSGGGALCIMPEGHRVHRNHDLEMKTGAINLANHTGATIVPVGIYTKNYKPRIFQRVEIRYGKAITIRELGLKNSSKEELTRVLNETVKPEIIRLSERDYKRP